MRIRFSSRSDRSYSQPSLPSFPESEGLRYPLSTTGWILSVHFWEAAGRGDTRGEGDPWKSSNFKGYTKNVPAASAENHSVSLGRDPKPVEVGIKTEGYFPYDSADAEDGGIERAGKQFCDRMRYTTGSFEKIEIPRSPHCTLSIVPVPRRRIDSAGRVSR